VQYEEGQEINYDFVTQSLNTKTQKHKENPKRFALEWPQLADAYAASFGNTALCPATQPIRLSATKITSFVNDGLSGADSNVSNVTAQTFTLGYDTA
jgi:hypothetical protein